MIKIAILGSTGSIGKKTIEIIKQNKNKYKVELLSTNTKTKELLKQSKQLKVKNLIITDQLAYLNLKKKIKKKNIKLFNNFNNLNSIFNKKIDYVMSSISGINGLEPTLKIIKFTKKIGIANKESIICAWNLIKNKLKRYNTTFVPVDSEHFSIWSLLHGFDTKNVDRIYITASGGPFLSHKIKNLNLVKPKDAIKHPKWKMGKKISVDSSTMMNKTFEILEASRIFNLQINKFSILIHENSYLHAVVKFKNGTTKLLIHDTDMKIPIFNSIYNNNKKYNKSENINFKVLNNLNLHSPEIKKFKCLSFIKKFPDTISLYDTVIVIANDELVNLFLNGKVKYTDIYRLLRKILNLKTFVRLKKIQPKNINMILNLKETVRLKINHLCNKHKPI
tara:strand:- start:876 stop:2051 length:1176 start_codon:yes stop_codon:yes gene_type:complete